MRFLRRFFSIFLGSSAPSPEATLAVRRDESPAATLSRFILESSRISGGQVNHRAFLPPPDLELSTFNIDELAETEIWTLGHRVRTEQGKQRLHGRAVLRAKSVYDAQLRPLRDDRPFRHVVIVGWPEKPLQKNKAQLLAAASVYIPLT
jgi:hypothetical protein